MVDSIRTSWLTVHTNVKRELTCPGRRGLRSTDNPSSEHGNYPDEVQEDGALGSVVGSISS